jgi:hypothetical protein
VGFPSFSLLFCSSLRTPFSCSYKLVAIVDRLTVGFLLAIGSIFSSPYSESNSLSRKPFETNWKMWTQALTVVAGLAAGAAAHAGHNHEQEPIGPHKSLWYNTLPGDGGTQVRWCLLDLEGN